jgi:hypothetical protein
VDSGILYNSLAEHVSKYMRGCQAVRYYDPNTHEIWLMFEGQHQQQQGKKQQQGQQQKQQQKGHQQQQGRR